MWLNADDVKFRFQAAVTPSEVSGSGHSRVWRRCGGAVAASRSLHVTKPGSVEGGRAIPVTSATNAGLALNELSSNFMVTGKSPTVGKKKINRVWWMVFINLGLGCFLSWR